MAEIPAARWRIWLAFATLYVVWGSTFLGIRVGVRVAPPLLFAGVRFLAAGLVLAGWTAVRRERWPVRREWGSICLLAVLIFAGDYGLLFWAERRVPAGLAAVMMATIPAFTAVSEIVLLRTQRMNWRLGVALLLGLGGVVVLAGRGLGFGGAALDGWGAVALVGGAICWSVGSALSKRLPLPGSKSVSAAAQMTVGGLMLLAMSVVAGEFGLRRVEAIPAVGWWAMLYLVALGSLVGFTTYTWLLQRESPTRVGTYAYVNPVVAVGLGYLVLHEAIGLREVVGSLLVLVSVVVITTMKRDPVAVLVAETGE